MLVSDNENDSNDREKEEGEEDDVSFMVVLYGNLFFWGNLGLKLVTTGFIEVKKDTYHCEKRNSISALYSNTAKATLCSSRHFEKYFNYSTVTLLLVSTLQGFVWHISYR